jgi:Uncharacterised nucleotidyltransferase
VAVRQSTEVSPAARVVAGNLKVDCATAEVLRAFGAAGVKSLLVKGVSVVRWLYDASEPRAYSDCDLVVRPADLVAAGEVLAELGFLPQVDERDMPTWWREHAVGWWRGQDGAIVDVHRTLPGVGVDPQLLWRTLSADAETIDVAGFPAKTLTIPGRAFHLAIHAAQHGVGWDRVDVEVERALSRVDESTWRAAAELAAALDAHGREGSSAGVRSRTSRRPACGCGIAGQHPAAGGPRVRPAGACPVLAGTISDHSPQGGAAGDLHAGLVSDGTRG